MNMREQSLLLLLALLLLLLLSAVVVREPLDAPSLQDPIRPALTSDAGSSDSVTVIMYTAA